MTRVAIIGGGVSGLGAALALRESLPERVQVVLYEQAPRLGGHANTVDITLPDAAGRMVTHGVDTGFLVYNQRTYPALIELFARLQVPVATSDMSFSVQVTPPPPGRVMPPEQAWLAGLVWGGSDLDAVFAQRKRLVSPPFLHMLYDILRFNRLATRLATQGQAEALSLSVRDFLSQHGFGQPFMQAYLLPMVACIWSCPVEQMMQFPVGTLIRFCHNHGLLQVANRPQWYTVPGGSREYVRRVTARFEQLGGQVRTDARVTAVSRGGDAPAVARLTVRAAHTDGSEQTDLFDEVVLACHSDQSLQLLGEHATPDEARVLGAVSYHANQAVLHTDSRLMPPARKAWSAWNYERTAPGHEGGDAVCLHYWINRLQPLPWQKDVVVTLNPLRQPRPETVLGTFDYAHPVFDARAIEAQARLPALQGTHGVWFCGAWTGYGFHEDGLVSGQRVARLLAERFEQRQLAVLEAAA